MLGCVCRGVCWDVFVEYVCVCVLGCVCRVCVCVLGCVCRVQSVGVCRVCV